MAVGTGLRAGDPLAASVGCSGEPVEGRSQLQHDIGAAGTAMMQVRQELPFDPGCAQAHFDLDPRPSERRDSGAGDQRVRIGQGHDHTPDARCDDRVGAGARPAVMVAGLEGRVEDGASCCLTGRGDRIDLGVRATGLAGRAGEHAGARNDRRTDPGVGRRDEARLLGGVDRPSHVVGVQTIGHGSVDPSDRCRRRPSAGSHGEGRRSRPRPSRPPPWVNRVRSVSKQCRGCRQLPDSIGPEG